MVTILLRFCIKDLSSIRNLKFVIITHHLNRNQFSKSRESNITGKRIKREDFLYQPSYYYLGQEDVPSPKEKCYVCEVPNRAGNLTDGNCNPQLFTCIP